MPPQRIVFTGGSGLAGRHSIAHLASQGHQILNLDKQPLTSVPGVSTLLTDLTDAGEVFHALAHTPFSNDEYDAPLTLAPVDAVIHFAAYPRPLVVPDGRMFAENVGAAYNVVDAAARLGVRKVVLASTQSIYGVAYSQHAANWAEFPIDEDRYDCNPTDSYGLSKLCAENVCRSFAARFGIDVYVLRIGYVCPPGEYTERMAAYLETPQAGRRIGWSYTDARDLGRICELCLQTSGLGFQVFNAVNDSVMSRDDTAETLRKGCPQVKMLREPQGNEAPTSNEKIKRLLGFKEMYDWKTEMEKEAKAKPKAAVSQKEDQ